jgi:hypothetical protein
MAITQAGAIGTGATTVYTSSGTTAITCMFFMNDNAASRTLSVHVVQSGGSIANTNQIVKTITIDPADSYVINTEKLVLSNGDTIQCTASVGSSIYPTISSVDI